MPKLVGAFVLFGALLMFLGSLAHMFDSWDSLKGFDSCLSSVNPNDAAYASDVEMCRTTLWNKTGIYPALGQGKLSLVQFWSALMPPVAMVLFWLAGLLIGWMLYRTGELVIPIEETVRELGPKRRFAKK
ncbi:MAG: hypothetical protein HY917_04075 [Candidatus Diapherotrites archaeon]|nr:hypothetical protein [Candidatus Diapherotrites archaeon]